MHQREGNERQTQPRYKRVVELLNEESRKLSRRLTLSEALERIRQEEEFKDMSRITLYHVVRRHSVESVQISHSTKDDPRYQDLERRIKNSVILASEQHGAPFKIIIAQLLFLSEKQLDTWLGNKGFVLGDVGILTRSQEVQLLYLSIAQLFHNFGLPFTRQLMADILQTKRQNVSIYLNLHPKLKAELYKMGLTDAQKK